MRRQNKQQNNFSPPANLNETNETNETRRRSPRIRGIEVERLRPICAKADALARQLAAAEARYPPAGRACCKKRYVFDAVLSESALVPQASPPLS